MICHRLREPTLWHHKDLRSKSVEERESGRCAAAAGLCWPCCWWCCFGIDQTLWMRGGSGGCRGQVGGFMSVVVEIRINDDLGENLGGHKIWIILQWEKIMKLNSSKIELLYRLTIQVVPNLLLTWKQKLHFSKKGLYWNSTLFWCQREVENLVPGCSPCILLWNAILQLAATLLIWELLCLVGGGEGETDQVCAWGRGAYGFSERSSFLGWRVYCIAVKFYHSEESRKIDSDEQCKLFWAGFTNNLPFLRYPLITTFKYARAPIVRVWGCEHVSGLSGFDSS